MSAALLISFNTIIALRNFSVRQVDNLDLRENNLWDVGHKRHSRARSTRPPAMAELHSWAFTSNNEPMRGSAKTERIQIRVQTTSLTRGGTLLQITNYKTHLFKSKTYIYIYKYISIFILSFVSR